MSENKPVYVGPWENAYLCSNCGEYLSSAVTESHWGKPCHNCGATDTYCPNSIQTSRRFVCTKRTGFWFWKKEEGFYEWTGKSGGYKLEAKYTKGRKILNTPTTIAAAGIASGLF